MAVNEPIDLFLPPRGRGLLLVAGNDRDRRIWRGSGPFHARAAVCYRTDKTSGLLPLGNVTGDAPRCSAFALINRSPQVEPAMPKSRLFHDMTALLTRSHSR